MPSRTVATTGLLVLLALTTPMAWGWQVVAPPVASPADPLPESYSPESYSPEWTPPAGFEPVVRFEPAWDAPDPGLFQAEAMYDTSIVPRWDRRYAFEGAADVPPFRSWYVPSALTGQLLWLNRTGPDSQALLTGGVQNPLTLVTEHSTAVTTSDLELPVEAGTRMSVLLGRYGAWQPELVYLGVFDQSATVTYNPVASAGVIETGISFFDLTILDPTTHISVSYESDLHSAEYNMWYDDGWRFQMLVGLRWIQQSDELEQFQTLSWEDGTFAQFTNNLLGSQIGFRSYLFERGKWSGLLIGKGGFYYNDVRLVADATNGGAVLGAFERTGNTTSAAGELNLTAVWQLTPYFNLHFGYTGLWLSEVGLVGDQLNDFTFASGGNFDYGGVSYQGGHFGLTWSW